MRHGRAAIDEAAGDGGGPAGVALVVVILRHRVGEARKVRRGPCVRRAVVEPIGDEGALAQWPAVVGALATEIHLLDLPLPDVRDEEGAACVEAHVLRMAQARGIDLRQVAGPADERIRRRDAVGLAVALLQRLDAKDLAQRAAHVLRLMVWVRVVRRIAAIAHADVQDAELARACLRSEVEDDLVQAVVPPGLGGAQHLPAGALGHDRQGPCVDLPFADDVVVLHRVGSGEHLHTRGPAGDGFGADRVEAPKARLAWLGEVGMKREAAQAALPARDEGRAPDRREIEEQSSGTIALDRPELAAGVVREQPPRPVARMKHVVEESRLGGGTGPRWRAEIEQDRRQPTGPDACRERIRGDDASGADLGWACSGRSWLARQDGGCGHASRPANRISHECSTAEVSALLDHWAAYSVTVKCQRQLLAGSTTTRERSCSSSDIFYLKLNDRRPSPNGRYARDKHPGP